MNNKDLDILGEMYSKVQENRDDDFGGRYFGAGTPFWGNNPDNIAKLSPVAQRLYNNIRRAGDDVPYSLTRDDYFMVKDIHPQELYQVLDTAIEFNFQLTDEMWNFMRQKDAKLYKDLRHSVGQDTQEKKLPSNDRELYGILKANPNFRFNRSTYKPNGGRMLYSDLKKRIRNGASSTEEGEVQIKELDDYIQKNRRFSNA